jgi:AcrR family transcriptional regulator
MAPARRRPSAKAAQAGSAKPEAARAGDVNERIFSAAMEVARQIGWRRAGLSDIARAAGLSLGALHSHYTSKLAILWGLASSADKAVLAASVETPDETESARDRLFDVLMRRFEALQPYRSGLAAIVREGGGVGALDAICGAQRLIASMRWMLEAAGIGSGGITGAVRAKGLAILYGATFATWLRDDTPDMARTMAALDRNLDRAEQLAGTFGMRRRRASPPPEQEAAAPV